MAISSVTKWNLCSIARLSMSKFIKTVPKDVITEFVIPLIRIIWDVL